MVVLGKKLGCPLFVLLVLLARVAELQANEGIFKLLLGFFIILVSFPDESLGVTGVQLGGLGVFLICLDKELVQDKLRFLFFGLILVVVVVQILRPFRSCKLFVCLASDCIVIRVTNELNHCVLVVDKSSDDFEALRADALA